VEPNGYGEDDDRGPGNHHCKTPNRARVSSEHSRRIPSDQESSRGPEFPNCTPSEFDIPEFQTARAMGAWGVAVFADDLALDVRDDWRDAILDGVGAEDAMALLEARYADAVVDEEEAVVFWLSLALAQTETGRLMTAVRDRAIEIIDTGGDIKRWREQDEGLARRRANVLNRLRAKLVGPQPAPKRLRRPRQRVPLFDVGDAILVRGPDAEGRGLVVVVGHLREDDPYSDTRPIVEVLDWRGGDSPHPEEIAAIPALIVDVHWDGHPDDSRKHVLLTIVPPGDKPPTAFGRQFADVIAKGVARASAEILTDQGRHGPYERALRLAITWPELATVIGTDELDSKARAWFAETLAHLADRWPAPEHRAAS
jgi:hypothetical protein